MRTTDIAVKNISNDNVLSELTLVGFDKTYLYTAENKYRYGLYKVFNLRPPEANILKQIALSVGTDCAVNRNVITSKIEYSDCLIGGSTAQIKQIIKKLETQPFRLSQVSELLNKQICPPEFELTVGERTFTSEGRYIMGILNTTPDSFSDGGKYLKPADAIKHAEEMLEEGADIIDIGAESTRPDHEPVSEEEEQSRLLPVLKEVRKRFPKCIISVDTRNAGTAQAAVDCGADIINDISSGEYDPKMPDTIAKLNVPYVLTHCSLSNREEGLADCVYRDLQERIKFFVSKGFDEKKIITDVGICFGKTLDDNFELVKRIKEFSGLGGLTLAGISRKTFLWKTLNLNPQDTDSVSSALNLYLFMQGVNILRVHNVKLTREILTIAEKMRQA
jgi:dihydropteroate synthase